MPTAAQAAIVRRPGQPMMVEDIELADPREGEVLVRIVSAGVCHTDMVMRDQLVPVPQPVVLGHEGAGIVERLGPGVLELAVGDPVVLSFNSCGGCRSCASERPAYCFQFGLYNFGGQRPDGTSAISQEGVPVHGNIFGQSSFATYAIAHERNAVKVNTDVSLEILGPLGCGIQTGAGAVLNSLRVTPGSTIVIFGAGALGLSAVMAARIAKAGRIIVTDVVPSRLALARELGATQAFDARDDAIGDIRALCPDGVEFVFDTTGIPGLIEDGVRLLAPGGVCGLVGASAGDAEITINETHLMSGGRMIRGIVEGDSVPKTFIPQLIEYHRNGEFPFDRLIRFFDFKDINDAFDASECGAVIKPVLRFSA